MTETQNIVLDILRAIRGDLAEVKASIADLKDGQISIREEIQSMRRDALRQERTIASLQVDVDRVKHRLELSDA